VHGYPVAEWLFPLVAAEASQRRTSIIGLAARKGLTYTDILTDGPVKITCFHPTDNPGAHPCTMVVPTALHCTKLNCNALHCSALHCQALTMVMPGGRLVSAEKAGPYIHMLPSAPSLHCTALL
jgi:hypothetical protein